MTIANTTSKLLLAALLGLATVPANALESNAGAMPVSGPKNTMPIPSQDSITGCWSSDGSLYGSYRLSFCVPRYGGATYTVSGNGLYCHATLGWQESWGTYGFAMRRTTCGQGVDWSPDTFSCVLKSGWNSGPVGAMPVQGGQLVCNYRPSVWGYGSTTFSAHRA
jgi:hypothetical protein